jgi:hemolysin activation/secretion protein
LVVAGANSFTEYGERSEVSLFGVPNSAQWFAQGSVESFIGGSGLKLKIYGGGGETRPTGVLRQIGYYGATNVGGLIANYPVIRSRPLNVFAIGSFDIFDNTIDQGTLISSRPLASHDSIRTLRIGADAQMLETWIPFTPAAATTVGSLRFSKGISAFGATANGYSLSGRSGLENFSFTKVSGEVQRNQPIIAPFDGSMISVQALFAGQYSSSILPLAEKFYLGGYRLGRGYYSGQITGDSGWGASFELQLDLPPQEGVDLGLGTIGLGFLGLGSWTPSPLRWTNQLYMFRDYGRTFENLAIDPNRRISSWGGGLRLVVNDQVQFDVEGVRRLVLQPNGAAVAPLSETAVYFRTLVRF